MNRNDRLIALLIALQRNSFTASQLAERFEVSVRTILRDMQSLSEMGVPLYSATGPGGGFRLMEGYRLPPLQLDTQEALTALFALHAVTRFGDSPFNRERWTVLDKIRALLPEETLRQIEPILGKMHLEVPRRSVRSPMLPLLLELLAESRIFRTLYRSQTTRRWLELHPLRVFAAHGFWYCEAFSPLHGEARTFRVDRMDELHPLEEEGDRNKCKGGQAESSAAPRSSLAGAAGDSSTDGDTLLRVEVPGELSAASAVAAAAGSSIPIAVRLTYRGSLLAEQDEHIGELVEQVGDEEWELRFDCPAAEWTWAVRFFYGMGLDAEVLSPPELRAAVASMAASVLERYNEDSDSGCS